MNASEKTKSRKDENLKEAFIHSAPLILVLQHEALVSWQARDIPHLLAQSWPVPAHMHLTLAQAD